LCSKCEVDNEKENIKNFYTVVSQNTMLYSHVVCIYLNVVCMYLYVCVWLRKARVVEEKILDCAILSIVFIVINWWRIMEPTLPK